MSRVEDILRRVLARRAEGATSVSGGLDAVLAESRRRTLRRRTTTVGIVAIAASIVGVTAFVVRNDDDNRPIVTTPPSSTSVPRAPESSTTVPGSTTSTTADMPPASDTAPPETVVVAWGSRLVVLDSHTGDELQLLDDVSRLPDNPIIDQVELGPDGVVWYVVRVENIDRASIWRVDPESGPPDEVVAPGTAPSISPDGRYLAYAGTTVDGGLIRYPYNVLVVRDLTSGNERRFEPAPAEEDFFLSGGRISDTAWAPGATHVVFGHSYEGYEGYELNLASASSLSDARGLAGGALHSLEWVMPGPTLLAIDWCCYPEEDKGRLVRYDADAVTPQTDGIGTLDLALIDVDPSGWHLLGVTKSDELHVQDVGGSARKIADDVTAAAW